MSVGTGLNGGSGNSNYTIEFNSTTTITSREYSLKIGKKDFNYTLNPTVKKFGTNPSHPSYVSKLQSPYMRDDILSGSLSGSWGPLMTTVGFYRKDIDGKIDPDPIMIARYPQAIKMRRDIDIILKIRIDI